MVKALMVVIVVAILGGGALYYGFYGGSTTGTLPGTTTTTSASTSVSAVASTGLLAQNGVPLYDCPKPALNSELYCAILPTGYQIAPHLPNAPATFCLANMTAGACSLLKQTQSNGVCDPNETADTSPLDCGCTGALISDPYSGRCAAPATVCQLQLQEQAAKAGG